MIAVEWLIEQLTPSITLQQKYIDDIKEQAMQMEKEQKKQLWDAAQANSSCKCYEELMTFEQYYNNTFNK
jgi:hypothetical protein